jgi:hypothetical protein
MDYGWSVKSDFLYVKFDDYTTFTNAPFSVTGGNIDVESARGMARAVHRSGSTLTAVDLNGKNVSCLKNASREPQGHIGLQSHHEGQPCNFSIW